MATSDNFAQTLKLQADIVRIVGDYVSLRRAGAQNYTGLCPFHKEKTPSFSVHASKQFYHCFGCGASGDVFSFVQKIENISFPEAVRAVAHKLGIALPQTGLAAPGEARLRTGLLEIHERAAALFEDCLRRPEGARAREYLAARGLEEVTIREFRLGFAPDSGFWLRDRLKEGFGEDLMRESGIFSWKQEKASGAAGAAESSSTGVGPAGAEPPKATGKSEVLVSAMYSRFRNRIMFPITNESGRVIAFTGRNLSTDERAGPKYLNSPETAIYSKSRVLFNLSRAREAIRALNYAILVEGQMDAISISAAGFRNVIASSGTAFTAAQAGLLARFSKQLVVNFDPDAAGAKATERTLGLLVEEAFEIRVLMLESGLDPDLFVRRKGRDAYAEALKTSAKYFDYLIERARQQFPVRSPQGKQKAVNYLLPHIQRVPSRIVRDALAEEIAQKLDIDSAILRQELKHAATTRQVTAVKTPAEAQVTEAEKILIRALASGSRVAAEDDASDRSGSNQVFDPARQARYVLSVERLHVGLCTESLIQAALSAPENGDLMELPLSDGERGLLAAILMKEDEELSAEKIEGAVRALARMQIRRRLQAIQRQLESTPPADDGKVRTLVEEKLRLKRALMNPLAAREPGSTSQQAF
ncbi:MAG: toprim domain-containing protein [Acidobacteria bacterium]|nr:toprim domain-containing protein [Acidobacteriota bacterium]